ncbi:Hypothetical_protein [Hexamita inflata]|uniref:Hypothetical_protein n=1 Tax=Hexamita inflata TaxID=28002 RepID=A0AA86P6Y2_9EUKA|nr:Hypothetical protein HINF_LOCUS19496 [Hexamita inflata]
MNELITIQVGFNRYLQHIDKVGMIVKSVLGFQSLNGNHLNVVHDVYQQSLNQSCRYYLQYFKPDFATFRFQSVLQLGFDLKHSLHAPFSPLLGPFLGCVRRDVKDMTLLELENRFDSFKGME